MIPYLAVMGIYDDTARLAAEADPLAVLQPLLAKANCSDLAFGGWLDPRTPPGQDGKGRIADLRAILHEPNLPHLPWLLLIEMQTRPSLQKLRDTLNAVGNFTSRHQDREGFLALSAMVHLTGSLTRRIDSRMGEYGTLHQPIPWDIEKDEAEKALDAVEAGTRSWGTLFWVALMSGAGEEIIVKRWLEAVSRQPDNGRREDLKYATSQFSELTPHARLWKRLLEEPKMWTESAIANTMIQYGRDRMQIELNRQHLLALLDSKFKGQAPQAVLKLIEEQESGGLLGTWFKAALDAGTYADFDAVLRQ